MAVEHGRTRSLGVNLKISTDTTADDIRIMGSCNDIPTWTPSKKEVIERYRGFRSVSEEYS